MKYVAVLLLLCVLPLNAQDYVLVSGAAGTPSFDTACKIWRLSAGSTALELMLDLGAEIGVMPSEQYPKNSKHWTVAMEVPGFYAIRAFPDEQTLVVWSEVEEGIGAVFCFDVRQLPDYKRAHPRGKFKCHLSRHDPCPHKNRKETRVVSS